MKIKQTILVLALFVGVGSVLIDPTAAAVTCGGVETSLISCDSKITGDGMCSDGSTISKVSIDKGIKCADGSNPTVKVENTGVWGLLLLVINILTAGVGIAAVGGVVYGSILYASAGGAADQVKKAKEIITNVVIGLVAYALMYSLLNFIIPGGFLT